MYEKVSLVIVQTFPQFGLVGVPFNSVHAVDGQLALGPSIWPTPIDIGTASGVGTGVCVALISIIFLLFGYVNKSGKLTW